MTFGSLFSGIGGLDLGLEWAGMKCLWQSEIDPYASAVLRKHWPHVPNLGDIKAIDPTTLPPVDLVCGGYPCQPFSMAGRRKGQGDDRHLWPAMRQVIAAVRPAWVLCENVAGHVTLGLDSVLSDLEAEGYSCQPLIVPACAVDAPHRRDRVWIVAHAEFPGNRRQIISDQVDGEEALRPTGGIGRPSVGGRKETLAHHDGALLPREEHEVCSGRHSADVCGEVLADSQGQSERTRLREDEQRGQRRGRPGDSSAQALPNTAGLGRGKGGSEPTGLIRESISLCDSIHVPDAHREQEGRATIPRGECCQWLLEPGVGRVAYGVPRRVDRLRCLGNAVVPQVAYEIGRAIMTAHHGVTA